MDRLQEFFNLRSKNVLVCIDWANVYNWDNIKREERVSKITQKVDPAKLFNYLSGIKQVKSENIKLFFGIDKAKESTLDNITRWVKLKTGNAVNNLEELINMINGIKSKEKISSNLWDQVRDVLMEYESTKRINGFKEIGYNISNTKDVKTFGNSINDLHKFKIVTSKIVQSIDNILSTHGQNDEMIKNGLIGKIKELRELLFQKVKDRKCDFDVDITIEIIRNFEKFDTFVIFSGDGDFAPAIKYFREKNKHVVIVSDNKKLGREIDNLKFLFRPKIIFANDLDIWQ